MPDERISTFSVTKAGRIAETYSLFSGWDLEMSLEANLKRVRDDNRIVSKSDAWLKEMIRIYSTRFKKISQHHSLIRLAQGGFSEKLWSPILLWHLCLRELLLADFIENWLFLRKEQGLRWVRTRDVEQDYIPSLKQRGLIDSDWKASSINRMASGLPRYAADFGLLEGGQDKEFAAFHLPDEALLYVLYWLREGTSRGDKILGDSRWKRFLLTRSQVEAEVLRLHQLGALRYQAAGDVVDLELKYPDLEAYVDVLLAK